MLTKKYLIAWIVVAAIVVAGFVSFAEAPTAFQVYDMLDSFGINAKYSIWDDDLGDVARSGVPTITVFKNQNGWNGAYNIGDQAVIYSTKTELEALKCIVSGVIVAAPDDWDGMVVILFYELNGTTGYITNVSDLIGYVQMREGVM